MTIGGAIAELQNLIDADDVPFYYKSGIKKVIETIQMEVNEQNRRLNEIAHRLDLHERAMAKAMRDTADTPQTDVYDYKGNGKWERSE